MRHYIWFSKLVNFLFPSSHSSLECGSDDSRHISHNFEERNNLFIVTKYSTQHEAVPKQK